MIPFVYLQPLAVLSGTQGLADRTSIGYPCVKKEENKSPPFRKELPTSPRGFFVGKNDTPEVTPHVVVWIVIRAPRGSVTTQTLILEALQTYKENDYYLRKAENGYIWLTC